jgi:hypothetical protein
MTEPAPKYLVKDLPPAGVLAEHVSLREHLSQPNQATESFMSWFMRDCWKKGRSRAYGMFWPAAADVPESRKFCKIVAADLADATTYQVSAQMMAAMREVYDSTLAKIAHLDEHELPGPRGFAWFDDPLVIRDVHGAMLPVRVITWAFQPGVLVKAPGKTDGFGRPLGDRVRMLPCVRISAWTHWDDDVVARRNAPEDAHEQLGNLTLLHSAVVPFGERFVPGGEPAGAKDIANADSVLWMVHVLWMFLGSEIITTARPRIPRSAARRAQRSIKHGEVSVVLLRRVTHPEEPPGHRLVDWSCRWVQQGHWRHLESYAPHPPHHAVVTGPDKICAVCDVECTWVRPCLKGPSDRPLRERAGTVHKLVR